MSMDDQSRRDRIRSEAEHRFARQTPPGRAAPPQGDLARWLEESPDHAEAYAATRATWDRLGALQDEPAMRAIKARVEARVRTRTRRRRIPGLGRSLALAAGVAAIAVAGVLGWRFLQPVPPPPAVFATAVGEQYSATLEDGSAITLNTGTRLEARIGADARRLVLRRGEALFEVRPDVARPFTVQVGDGTVTALGTRFLVRHYGVQSTVTLLEGSVEVRDARNRAVVLWPAEQARFDDSGAAIAVRRVDLDAVTGWTRGWLIFHDEPLAQAVAEVNLYSEHKLRLGDPSLAQLPISGNFRLGDSASIARALAVLLPLDVEERDGELVLIGRH